MASVFTPLLSCITIGNVLLAVLFVLIAKQLLELYELRGMPPGPRFSSIPFIGNILNMNSEGATLYENTRSLRKTFGGLFTLKLGSWRTVFAATPESIKEVLVTKSAEYAGRPMFYSMSLFTLGGKDIVMADYGPAWKFHRKIFVSALRQYLTDIPLIEGRVTKQAKGLLRYFDQQEGNAFDPKSILNSSVANVISEITFGEEYDASHPGIKKMVNLSEELARDNTLISLVLALDQYPIMRYLPFGPYKKLEKLIKTVFDPSLDILREMEKKFDPDEPVKNLTQALLKARNEAEFENAEEKSTLLNEDYMLGSINDMFQAGYDTTASTLSWIIAFLVNYPHYQEELQQQIDEVVGRDKLPGLNDRPNLPLVHAFIMESQRLGNVAEATVPHSARKDTTLCGYRIPKDTVIMVDLVALHLDRSCWNNPEEFNPYRHIDYNGQLITNQGNWLPFSAGRRVCAGETLAKVELFLFLTIMLHGYTFLLEEGKPPPSLEGERVSTHAPKPYKIRVAKRK